MERKPNTICGAVAGHPGVVLSSMVTFLFGFIHTNLSKEDQVSLFLNLAKDMKNNALSVYEKL